MRFHAKAAPKLGLKSLENDWLREVHAPDLMFIICRPNKETMCVVKVLKCPTHAQIGSAFEDVVNTFNLPLCLSITLPVLPAPTP